MYKNERSCIVIKDNAILVVDSETYSFTTSAIHIAGGFMIELGRNINEFIEALKVAQLPYYFKLDYSRNGIDIYGVYRIATGNIPAMRFAAVKCKGDILLSLNFKTDRDVVTYAKYRMFSKFQFFRLPYELGDDWYRGQQAQRYISLLMPGVTVDKVKEEKEKRLLQLDLRTDYIMYRLNLLLDDQQKFYNLALITFMNYIDAEDAGGDNS